MSLLHGLPTGHCCPDCLSHILEDGTCDCGVHHWIALRGDEIGKWERLRAAYLAHAAGGAFAPTCKALAAEVPPE